MREHRACANAPRVASTETVCMSTGRASSASHRYYWVLDPSHVTAHAHMYLCLCLCLYLYLYLWLYLHRPVPLPIPAPKPVVSAFACVPDYVPVSVPSSVPLYLCMYNLWPVDYERIAVSSRMGRDMAKIGEVGSLWTELLPRVSQSFVNLRSGRAEICRVSP